MNPEVLEGWKCEGKKRMSTDMIMEWARAWEEAQTAPKFEVISNKRKADIRVTFSGKISTIALIVFDHSPKVSTFSYLVCECIFALIGKE